MRKKRVPTSSEEQAKMDKKTRLVALAFAFVGVFYFFIKLLFL